MTGRPYQVSLDRQRNNKCPETCEICTSAKKINKCLSKNCVYIIECTHCHLVYIGETSRTVGSGIKEHVRMEKKLFISISLNIPIRQCLKTSYGTFYITTFHNIRHARPLKPSKSVRKIGTLLLVSAAIGITVTVSTSISMKCPLRTRK